MSLPEPAGRFHGASLNRAAGFDEIDSPVLRSHVREARQVIARWHGYEPTPLLSLPGLAEAIGVRDLYCKYEASRFGLGSFKALGGAFALRRRLSERLGTRSDNGSSTDGFGNVTAVTASDGNHGLSVAWGAREAGCRCIVYLHERVSPARERLIADMGAQVRRIAGTYDDSTARAQSDAIANDWLLVADTSDDPHDPTTLDIMTGYAVMIEELEEQIDPASMPTHVLVQGGCGGLAAAVFAPLWERHGSARPIFVTVEPDAADCLYRSGVAGAPTMVPGSLETIMSGLSVGRVSMPAWPLLKACVDGYLAISDEAAIDTMRKLAGCTWGDPAIALGDSGVVGLAGLRVLAEMPAAREHLRLDRDSRVLVFGTEGAVDRETYDRLVAEAPVPSSALS